MTTATERLAVFGQVLGLFIALIGLYLLVGLPWTLLAGGVALLVFGVATEAGYLRGKPRGGE